jgi:hypothetical protein
MATGDQRPSIGIDAAISGAGLGIPLLLWVFGELKVHTPKLVLYFLLVVSGVMIAGPWIILAARRPKRRKAPLHQTKHQPPSLLPRGNALIAAAKKLEESKDLTDLLREGLSLQGALDAQEDSKPPHKDDPVYRWARETWVALQHQRPLVAQAFFGNKSPYGSAYFATAYGVEVDRIGRRAYLAERIATLAAAVEPASRTEAKLPLPSLADQLSRFKERGVAIRRDIKPPKGYATSSVSVLSQAMPVLPERSVRSWSVGVRLHLENHAPRFLVIFDEGPDLPPPHMFSVVATVNRQELLAFLDHKLAALDRIIRTLIEGADA